MSRGVISPLLCTGFSEFSQPTCTVVEGRRVLRVSIAGREVHCYDEADLGASGQVIQKAGLGLRDKVLDLCEWKCESVMS